MRDSSNLIGGLSNQADALERSVQEAAFAVLREHSDYELSQELLAVASDVKRISRRLAGLISRPPEDKPKVGATVRPTRRVKKHAYPVFRLEGDRVVKIGKGKSKGATEYRHEAPQSALRALGRWIEATQADGRREWTAAEAASALADTVPSYQVYLMLGALRDADALQLVTRGTYALSEPSTSTGDLWLLLQSRLNQVGDEAESS